MISLVIIITLVVQFMDSTIVIHSFVAVFELKENIRFISNKIIIDSFSQLQSLLCF